MELNKEKFEYQQELANLGAEIAKASGELARLKSLHDEEVINTTKDTIEAQNKALEASKEVISEIYSTKDELVSYTRDLEGVMTSFTDWLDNILLEIQKIRQEQEDRQVEINEQIELISKEKYNLAIQKEDIVSNKKKLLAFEKDLKDRQKLLNHKLTLLKNYERQ